MPEPKNKLLKQKLPRSLSLRFNINFSRWTWVSQFCGWWKWWWQPEL